MSFRSPLNNVSRNAKNYTVFYKHLDEVAALLEVKINEKLRNCGIIVRGLRSDRPLTSRVMAKLENQTRPIQGQATVQQIEAFAEILSQILCFEPNEKHFKYRENIHVALNALTQSGKTGLINVCQFLKPVLHLLTGLDFVVVRLLINNNTLESQSDIASDSFLELYGPNIEFEFDGHKFTLDDYSDDLIDRVPKLGVYRKPSYRTSGSQKLFFNQLKNIVKGTDSLRMLACCDESHSRTDKNSVLHNMLKSEERWIDDKICYMALSATNFAFNQFAKDRGYPIINMEPGEGYVGYGWIGEEKYDMQVPEIFSLSEFNKKTGINLHKVKDLKKLDPTRHPDGLKACLRFRDSWMWEIYKFAKYCLVDNNTNNSKGVVIRGLNNNAVMADIVSKLNNRFGDEICFILYTGDTKKDLVYDEIDNPVNIMINKYAGPPENRRPYVLIGTGEFRCGNDLGGDCLCGVEFGDKMEPQVLMQGIAGRLTGYKARTLVILSEYNAKMLKNYIESGVWEVESKSGRKQRLSPCKRHLCVNIPKGYERINSMEIMDDKLLVALNKVVKQAATVVKCKNSKSKIKRENCGYILPVRLYKKISDLVKVKLKSANVFDATKNVKNGKLKIIIRLDGNATTMNMGRREQVKVASGTIEKRTEPAFIVDENLNIVYVQLVLDTPIYTQSPTNRLLYKDAA